MEKIVESKEEEQQVMRNIIDVIDDIIDFTCAKTSTPMFDVEILAVAKNGNVLESAQEMCRYFIAVNRMADKGFDLFCSVVPYYSLVKPVQRNQHYGVPVRVSALLTMAVTWADDDEYNTVMGYLTQLLCQITGVEDAEIYKEKLLRVIDAHFPKAGGDASGGHEPHNEHDKDCVCQQTPRTLVRAVLNFVSGKSYDLKWDIALFFMYNGRNLSSLELFNLVLAYSNETMPLELVIRGGGIPYGWSPEDTSGDNPIRLSELITHACTWTGGDEQRETIFDHLSRILSTLTREEEDPDTMHAELVICYNALHNTRLH